MMIQNCLGLLEKISRIEKQIEYCEKIFEIPLDERKRLISKIMKEIKVDTH